MADIVANTGAEFKTFIDFVTSVSDMPFCIDAWVMKPKLEGAAYCAEKGLLDRMFYNSLTVWEAGPGDGDQGNCGHRRKACSAGGL